MNIIINQKVIQSVRHNFTNVQSSPFCNDDDGRASCKIENAKKSCENDDGERLGENENDKK